MSENERQGAYKFQLHDPVVSGTVTDKIGSVVKGAKVTLKNLATGVTDVTTTDREGKYHFIVENPGTYDLEITFQDFHQSRQIVITSTSPPEVSAEATVAETVVPAGPQQLLPNATTPNLLEGFEARIKDPLWFLALGYMTGEFIGENAGGLAQVEIVASSIPVNKIDTKIDSFSSEPLEALIEAETEEHSPFWDPSRLEYECDLSGQGLMLHVSEYEGRDLDWYNFDANRVGSLLSGDELAFRLVPASLQVAGMPSSRFWKFEPNDTNVTLLASAEPNFLQMLLAEFLMVDSDNWFRIPVDMRPGHIQRLSQVRVIDSFGIATDMKPVLDAWRDDGWSVFTLSSQDGSSQKIDGSYMYLPNIVPTLAQTEGLEDVHFLPDEMSNKVWAVERYYTDQLGERINRGDVESTRHVDKERSTPDSQSHDEMPVFRLMQSAPRNWIPYQARRLKRGAASEISEVYLRRGRTDENATQKNPQYCTRIVGESWKLHEEEIPRTGLRVQRLWKYAMDSNGADHFWIGRRTDISTAEHGLGIDFDYVVDTNT
jgi:Carboxypeptidase regulatory-like domain